MKKKGQLQRILKGILGKEMTIGYFSQLDKNSYLIVMLKIFRTEPCDFNFVIINEKKFKKYSKDLKLQDLTKPL